MGGESGTGAKGENYAGLVPQFPLFSRVPHVARPSGAAPPFHLQIHIARTTQNSRHARKRHALFA